PRFTQTVTVMSSLPAPSSLAAPMARLGPSGSAAVEDGMTPVTRPCPGSRRLSERSGALASINRRAGSRTPSDSRSAEPPRASSVTERVSAGSASRLIHWSPAAVQERGGSRVEPSELRRPPSQARRRSASVALAALRSGGLDLDVFAVERHPDLAAGGLGEG